MFGGSIDPFDRKRRNEKTENEEGRKRNVVKLPEYARKKREIGGSTKFGERGTKIGRRRDQRDREKRLELRRIRLKNDLISRLVYLSVSGPLPLSRTDSRKKRMKMKTRMKKERRYSFDRTRTACAVSVPCYGILRTRAPTFNEQIFSANVAAVRRPFISRKRDEVLCSGSPRLRISFALGGNLVAATYRGLSTWRFDSKRGASTARLPSPVPTASRTFPTRDEIFESLRT